MSPEGAGELGEELGHSGRVPRQAWDTSYSPFVSRWGSGQGRLSQGADCELALYLLLHCGTRLNERWAQADRAAHAGRPERGGVIYKLVCIALHI